MTWFTPRDRRAAARWLRLALLASAVVPWFSVTTFNSSFLAAAAVVVTSAICAMGAAAMWAGWLPGPLAWGLWMPGAAALAVGCNVATDDASATGLVYFLLPPMLAALHLRHGGAWLTAAGSSVGVAVVVGVLMPPAVAVSNWATMSAVIALLTALLFRKAQRNADLVSQLQHLAAVDPLTGLVTRRVLDQATAAAMHGAAALLPEPRSGALAAERRTSQGCAFLVIDVDHFKAVNDTYGHPAGDAALCHLGRVLGDAVRRVDAQLATCAVVSRLGGDELAVLLPSCSLELAQTVAVEIVAAVRAAPLVLSAHPGVPLTVSVGLAHSPSHARDVETLYRSADLALYDAKHAGRDGYATCASPTQPPRVLPTASPPHQVG